VEVIRVEAARRRLEETEVQIESVAEDSGFSNEELAVRKARSPRAGARRGGGVNR